MNISQTVRYIYVGRLDAEKGVDCIIESFSQLFDQGASTISLDIFGRGSLSHEIQQFADRYVFVNYHGFQKKTTVFEIWKESDYCLMPSRFLETFGLSALDSLCVGVPIIAPSKGGLTSFVLPELTMNSVTTDELLRVVMNAQQIKNNTQSFLALGKKSKQIYFQYSRSSWYSKLCTIGLPENLLVVSDYGANHGGIETLIEEIDRGLVKQGHDLTHFVATTMQLTHIQRYLGLIKTIGNIGSAYRIRPLSDVTELVWRHSVHRQLGWLPMWISSTIPQHRIMIHDMGLLHPFPAFVEHESQIENASSLSGRIHEGVAAKGWVRFPLLIAKRVSVWMIRRQIKSKNMIIQVPSEYLKNHVYRKVSTTQKILVIPHFILPPKNDGNNND